MLSYAPGSFYRESHDDAAVHAEENDPYETVSYRPTQWQVALSPDGAFTAILLSHSLKINNNFHALAEQFRVYPKGRQIAWSACSSFVFILASNGEDIQIINQQGELIHSISASALNKQVANKNCIKICPIATQEDKSIAAHCVYSDGTIITVRIENQKTHVIGTTTLSAHLVPVIHYFFCLLQDITI